MFDIESLYTTDYAPCAKRHVALPRARRLGELDIAHPLDELNDMVKRKRCELESRLLILVAHLLKWECRSLSARWRELKGASWRGAIIEKREHLAILLRPSFGLKSAVAHAALAANPDTFDLENKGTGLPPETFPARSPYSVEPLFQDHSVPPTRLERQNPGTFCTRLMAKEIAAIDLATREWFAPRSTMRLFGPRLDDPRRGGVTDLLIEPPMPLRPQDMVESRSRFIARLYRQFRERQVDVLIVPASVLDERPVVQAAKREGRLLTQVAG